MSIPPSPSAASNNVPAALAWMAVVILLLLNILSHIDRTIITLMVDPIKASLKITDVEFSLLQGVAFTLFYAFASLPMGWIADKKSRHWVIYIGVSGWSICTALCGLTGQFWQMFLARLGVGAGEATLAPASYALVGDLFTRKRIATAASVLAAGGAIGASAAYAIGGVAIAWAQSIPPVLGLEPWQLVFVMVGLPGLLLAPLVFLIPGRHRKAATSTHPLGEPQAGYLAWLRSNAGVLIPLFTGLAFNSIQTVGATAWMPSYLIRHFGMSAGETGVTLGLVAGIPGTLGFILGGYLVDRMSARGIRHPHVRFLLIFSTLTSLLGLATFTLCTGSLTATLIVWAMLNLVLPNTGPSVAFVQHVTPSRFRARTTAILFVVMYLFGMGAGPVIVALFTEHLFGGPEHVGSGLLTIFMVFLPLTALFYTLTMQGRVMEAQDDGSPASEPAALGG